MSDNLLFVSLVVCAELVGATSSEDVVSFLTAADDNSTECLVD